MLLFEKLKQPLFSKAEQRIVDYIVTHPEELADMTTQNLATLTNTHPTSLIRVAKKVDCSGWVEMKDALTKEWNYFTRNFNTVNANVPFHSDDSPLLIAGKLAALDQQTIEDTVSLLDPIELKNARHFLLQAKSIKLFTSQTNAQIAQDFVLKMRRIGRDVMIASSNDYPVYEAHNSNSDTCAILISYTGETSELRKCMEILLEKKAKIISITSLGENSLSKLSHCRLTITTREKLYSKVANFSSNTSIIFLLNLLYSLVFADEMDKNLDHLIEIGKSSDSRTSRLPIINEIND